MDIHVSFLSLIPLCLQCGATAEAEAKAKDGEKEDYKGDSKFASHLKTAAGVSAFAKTRTLKEQREYLPAFAVREELLHIIRDNQGALPPLPFLSSAPNLK